MQTIIDSLKIVKSKSKEGNKKYKAVTSFRDESDHFGVCYSNIDFIFDGQGNYTKRLKYGIDCIETPLTIDNEFLKLLKDIKNPNVSDTDLEERLKAFDPLAYFLYNERLKQRELHIDIIKRTSDKDGRTLKFRNRNKRKILEPTGEQLNLDRFPKVIGDIETQNFFSEQEDKKLPTYEVNWQWFLKEIKPKLEGRLNLMSEKDAFNEILKLTQRKKDVVDSMALLFSSNHGSILYVLTTYPTSLVPRAVMLDGKPCQIIFKNYHADINDYYKQLIEEKQEVSNILETLENKVRKIDGVLQGDSNDVLYWYRNRQFFNILYQLGDPKLIKRYQKKDQSFKERSILSKLKKIKEVKCLDDEIDKYRDRFKRGATTEKRREVKQKINQGLKNIEQLLFGYWSNTGKLGDTESNKRKPKLFGYLSRKYKITVFRDFSDDEIKQDLQMMANSMMMRDAAQSLYNKHSPYLVIYQNHSFDIPRKKQIPTKKTSIKSWVIDYLRRAPRTTSQGYGNGYRGKQQIAGQVIMDTLDLGINCIPEISGHSLESLARHCGIQFEKSLSVAQLIIYGPFLQKHLDLANKKTEYLYKDVLVLAELIQTPRFKAIKKAIQNLAQYTKIPLTDLFHNPNSMDSLWEKNYYLRTGQIRKPFYQRGKPKEIIEEENTKLKKELASEQKRALGIQPYLTLSDEYTTVVPRTLFGKDAIPLSSIRALTENVVNLKNDQYEQLVYVLYLEALMKPVELLSLKRKEYEPILGMEFDTYDLSQLENFDQKYLNFYGVDLLNYSAQLKKNYDLLKRFLMRNLFSVVEQKRNNLILTRDGPVGVTLELLKKTPLLVYLKYSTIYRPKRTYQLKLDLNN